MIKAAVIIAGVWVITPALYALMGAWVLWARAWHGRDIAVAIIRGVDGLDEQDSLRRWCLWVAGE